MRGEGEVESFASDGHVIIRCTACRTKTSLFLQCTSPTGVSHSWNSVGALWYWLQAVSGCSNGASPCRVCVR